MTSTLPRRKLPIGIQNLREIREGGYYYVDKSPHALRLIDEGKYFFLSRPRRFGKSLFLDTLKELFEGNRALFEGLYAEQHWDWSRTHPVLRLSFADGVLKSRAELDRRIADQLEQAAEALGATLKGVEDLAGAFAHLIRDVNRNAGARVAVLIDEYDKPILDNLEDEPVALKMREGLKNIYSVLKGADPHLTFVLLTGVSKFSKVSLFSGLNNLRDITISTQYSTVCGYTEEDVDTVFAPELPGLDREQIREWYNGYNWLGESVYNPFDMLLLFQERAFRAYWYETGTPAFLIKLLSQRATFVPNLEHLHADELLLSTFDVGKIGLEALLFQTGYLTLAEKLEQFGGISYRLCYPNQEVRRSFTNSLLQDWTPAPGESVVARADIGEALLRHDVRRVGEILTAFFSRIPYQWHTRNEIARYEGYYASVFYAFFASLGLDIRVEESSHAGRLDMAILYENRAVVFEFKVVEEEAEGTALAQLRERGYAEGYRAEGREVTCVGVEFSRARRTIVGWEVEEPPARARVTCAPGAS